MHRKDYIMLCHAIARGTVAGDLMSSIVSMLQEDNPKFSEIKFKDYLAKLVASYEDEMKDTTTTTVSPEAAA